MWRNRSHQHVRGRGAARGRYGASRHAGLHRALRALSAARAQVASTRHITKHVVRSGAAASWPSSGPSALKTTRVYGQRPPANHSNNAVAAKRVQKVRCGSNVYTVDGDGKTARFHCKLVRHLACEYAHSAFFRRRPARTAARLHVRALPDLITDSSIAVPKQIMIGTSRYTQVQPLSTVYKIITVRPAVSAAR